MLSRLPGNIGLLLWSTDHSLAFITSCTQVPAQRQRLLAIMHMQYSARYCQEDVFRGGRRCCQATTADAEADTGDEDEDDDEDDTATDEPEDDLTMSADASGSLIDDDLDDDELNDPQLVSVSRASACDHILEPVEQKVVEGLEVLHEIDQPGASCGYT